MWLAAGLILFIALVLLLAAVIFSARQTQRRVDSRLDKLADSAARAEPLSVDEAVLSLLPDPVARYFNHVFTDACAMNRLVRFTQTGQLKISPSSKSWSPFKARCVVSEEPPGFIWDATVRVMSIVPVRVEDSWQDGIGAGQVRFMSAFSIAREEDISELNAGAMYRYLAESVWHPTALLPQSGVQWEAVDENTAIAHLAKFGVSVSLEFRFNQQGEITGVYTEDRYGKFDGRYVRHPWEGRFSDYRDFNGVKIPVKGEVGWHLPQGWWLFWQGKIVAVENH